MLPSVTWLRRWIPSITGSSRRRELKSCSKCSWLNLIRATSGANIFRYWDVIQAQWSLLDSTLHAPDAVRQRSALLTTTILAIGSTSLATRPDSTPEQISEALSLHAHVEKLSLVIFATGAKSIEIVQAHIVRCSVCFDLVRTDCLKITASVSLGNRPQDSSLRESLDTLWHDSQDGRGSRTRYSPAL